MGRGRPSFLNDRVSTTVSLEREDLAKLHDQDVDISVEFREWVQFRLNKNQTPLEKMRAEERELTQNLKELAIKRRQLRKLIKEEEAKEVKKNAIQAQLEEFENEREQVFLTKFRKLIFKGAICEIDFYSNVRKELKFNDPAEAKEWLLERYKIQRPGERQFTEDRIKMFLRWDKDVSTYW